MNGLGGALAAAQPTVAVDRTGKVGLCVRAACRDPDARGPEKRGQLPLREAGVLGGQVDIGVVGRAGKYPDQRDASRGAAFDRGSRRPAGAGGRQRPGGEGRPERSVALRGDPVGVLAIGNPFGLEGTVTVGILSAKGRIIAGPYDDFFQTDAAINPGNSGGPLFGLRGEVVGINTAIIAQAQGVGFAIPINLAKELLPQLKEEGRITRGWLGVVVRPTPPEMASSGAGKGALVAAVDPDGPAAKGGVKPWTSSLPSRGGRSTTATVSRDWSRASSQEPSPS
jgi:Trypsin-like peptidase domain